MYSQPRKPAAALILALLFVLIFMGLSMNMIIEARSQANYQGGIRLAQNYEMAAVNAINRERMSLKEKFVQPSPLLNAAPSEYRFGFMLQSGVSDPDFPDYGVLINSETVKMNNDRLELETRVFAKNNPDDFAYSLKDIQGTVDGETQTINENWDFDGKVLLTAVVTQVGSKIPLSVMSIGIAPTDLVSTERGGNVKQEAGEEDQSNQGYEEGTVTLDDFK